MNSLIGTTPTSRHFRSYIFRFTTARSCGSSMSNGSRILKHNQLRIQDFPLRGTNLRRGRFSAKTCAKTKELGRARTGGTPLPPTDLPSANDNVIYGNGERFIVRLSQRPCTLNPTSKTDLGHGTM